MPTLPKYVLITPEVGFPYWDSSSCALHLQNAIESVEGLMVYCRRLRSIHFILGEVAVGKAAAGLPAVVDQTTRGVRIPSLSATF
jgi:hypothetical protein